MVALGLHCCAWAFSSCGELGLLSCGPWVSHCGGFSCGAEALGTRASAVAARGLKQLQHVGWSSCRAWAKLLCSTWNILRTGIKPMFPCIGRQILIHWTTQRGGQSDSSFSKQNPKMELRELGIPSCLFQIYYLLKFCEFWGGEIGLIFLSGSDSRLWLPGFFGLS